MRAKRPATSTAASCQRCTAVLLAAAPRCTLCGWPSGEAYPTLHEDDLAAQPPVEADVPETTPVEDHHVQLDALTALMARQQPSALEPEAVQAELDEAAMSDPEVDEPAAESVAPAEAVQQLVGAAAVLAPTAPLDPLTAPLATLVDGDAATAWVVEPTSQPPARSEVATVGLPDDSTDGDTDGDTAGPLDVASTPESADPADDDWVAAAPVPPAAAGVRTPLHGLGRQATGAVLAVVALTAVVTMLGYLALLSLGNGVEAALGGQDPSAGVGLAAVLGVAAVGLGVVDLAAWIAAGVLFLLWVHAARANLTASPPVRQRWSPTWSVVGWLIPVFNIVLGWQVLEDLWRGSDPSSREVSTATGQRPVLPLVWMASFATGTATYVIGRFVDAPFVLSLVGLVALVAAAYALAGCIRQISAWQDSTPA
jgi:hypothetical protein